MMERRKLQAGQTLFIVLSAVLLALALVAPALADDAETALTPAEIIASVKVIHAPGAGVETDLSAAALKVAVDPATGKFRPLTAKESRDLGQSEGVCTGRSSTQLKSVEMSDGTIRLDLQGQFMSLSTVERQDDGLLSGQCVGSADQAFAATTTEEVRNDR